MKNKKTLLLVTHAFTPESCGGVEVYTRNLYEEFKKSDRIEPVVLTRTQKNIYHEGLVFGDEEDPNLFYIHTALMDMSSMRGAQGYDEGFKLFLQSLRPELVHFQHFVHLSMNWFRIVRDVLPEAKILLTLHEYMLLCPNGGRMVKTRAGQKNGILCLEPFSSDCGKCFPFLSPSVLSARESYVKECVKNADLVTAPSNFLGNVMVERLGISREKVIYSENGQKVFQPILRQRSKNGRLTLGFLGQINSYKGLHILLDAMAKIEGVHDIHLRIHGVRSPGPDEQYYGSKIKPRINKFKQVELCGPYTREQLPDILQDVDLVVVPSVWWENSPLVIQEAFMAKVPVICSNIGGMAEKVTDGVSGLHFAVNDSEDLYEKIVHVYKNRGALDLFRKNIPEVKTIAANALELENIYCSL